MTHTIEMKTLRYLRMGFLLLLALALSTAHITTEECSTDTECADLFGGNGDPEPLEVI